MAVLRSSMLASLPERERGGHIEHRVSDGESIAANRGAIHAAPTFPDVDLSIQAVVQDEAVARLQGGLGERVLSCYESDGHGSACIRNLHEGDNKKRHFCLLLSFSSNHPAALRHSGKMTWLFSAHLCLTIG